MKINESQIRNIVEEYHSDALERARDARHLQHAPKTVEKDPLAVVIEAILQVSHLTPPLQTGETAAVTLSRPKTAALIFDRVWGQPNDIGFALEAPLELAMYLPSLLDLLADPKSRKEPSNPSEDPPALIAQISSEKILAEIYRRAGLHVVPVFENATFRKTEYTHGNQAVLLHTIDNLDIIDEQSLEWDQVHEIRKDQPSRIALRNLSHWLDKEMVGQPANYISDELALRLDNYQRAVRKHGVKTVVGALQQVITPQYLAGASAVGAAVDFIMKQPFFSLLASGAVVLAGATLSLAEILLRREDVDLEHREVLYIYNLKKRREKR